MSSPWIFICSSSRGIGHALTRHLLLHTRSPILATTRHADPNITKATLLKDLLKDLPSGQEELGQRLSVVRCDVTDEASVAAAARRAAELFPSGGGGGGHHLQLACVMPGVLLRPERALGDVDAGMVMEAFRVNSLGPLLLAKHFFEFLPRRCTTTTTTTTTTTKLPEPEPSSSSASGSASGSTSESGQAPQIHLPHHAIWLTTSARLGSTTDNRAGGWFSYRASKAAVNSLTRSLDIHLRMRAGDGAMAVAYHPGTVRTAFSRDYWASVPREQLLSPEFAAERLVSVVCGLQTAQRGRCWDWKGDEVPP